MAIELGSFALVSFNICLNGAGIAFEAQEMNTWPMPSGGVVRHNFPNYAVI
jgi:hypothetical protein